MSPWEPHEAQAPVTDQKLGACHCRRAKNEYLRSELQNARQHRGGGTRLKQGPLDPWGVSEEDFTKVIGEGRSRSAVAVSTLAALNVRPGILADCMAGPGAAMGA